jgi:hypothetical protein
MTEAEIEAELLSLRARLLQIEQEPDFGLSFDLPLQNERTCGVAAFFCDRANRMLKRPGPPPECVVNAL